MPRAQIAKIVRFGCVGGVSTIIHLACQHVAVDVVGLQPQLGYVAAFACTFFAWSWPAHHVLTFRNPGPARATLVGWLVRSALLQVATLGLFSLGIALAGAAYHLWATIVASVIVQAVGYWVAHCHFALRSHLYSATCSLPPPGDPNA